MSTKRSAYPTDVTDAEWHILQPLLPAERFGGRHREYHMRDIIDATQYVLRGGIAWRMIPHDLPHWRTVYGYFRQWKKDGTWIRIHDCLHEDLRKRMGRKGEPSAAIIDSQSVKTTEKGGSHGYDGAKKINGRKRHILVDTTGLLLRTVVSAANMTEGDGAVEVLTSAHKVFQGLELIWADMGYREHKFQEWVKTVLKINLEIVRRPQKPRGVWVLPDQQIDWEAIMPPSGFHVLARRWVVERTFGWLGRYRRLSKDYEYLTNSSETMIYLAMTRLMLRRLARKAPHGIPSPQRLGLKGLARAF